MLNLAYEAILAFPGMQSDGWYVAILQQQPIFLEGNVLWGIDLIELPHGISLADA